MALGSFANLEPYRLPASQNPLDVLIQGFQQGVALQQIPEQLRNARLNEALKQQLQESQIKALQLSAAKSQYDLDNPNAKFMDDLRSAVIENKFGIERLDPNLPSLAQPGAITMTEDETLARIPVGPGFESDIPRAAPLGPTLEQIIASNGQPTGFTQDLSRIPVKREKPFSVGGNLVELNPQTGEYESVFSSPNQENAKSTLVQGYDTKTGLYGGYELSGGETLPAGVVPASQVIPSVGGDGSITGTLKGDKKSALKAIPNEQVNQLSGIDILENRLDQIEKSPKSVRSSNVGWLDSITGAIQSATGVGTEQTIKANEAFRTAVDSLIGEYSFGRGGKALTIVEREILGKYLPSLTNSDGAFESRLSTFRALTKELKEARIKALREGGYDTSRYETSGSSQTPAPNNSNQNNEAMKWLLDNPNDPDAPAVRKKLGL